MKAFAFYFVNRFDTHVWHYWAFQQGRRFRSQDRKAYAVFYRDCFPSLATLNAYRK